MPSRKPYHRYRVTITSYATATIKERAESGVEPIIDPAQIAMESVYSGEDERQASVKFFQAIRKARKEDTIPSFV
jgi:4-aminobutyrate aminotransferase-like enzyme